MTLNIVCAGGGTGGHIYPGIAVCDEIQALAKEKGLSVNIHWIGNKSGMDKGIVEHSLTSSGGSIHAFYGIPCGKLRRYFSLKNIADVFRIIGGFFSSLRLLLKIKPACVFSKGGFVSVPPCWAARLLRIPYYTHECDCTPGLATRLNSGGAKGILLSYMQTKKYFSSKMQKKCIVTGNPIRPVFYTECNGAYDFLSVPLEHKKPILLVIGGSLGAKQINDLIVGNLDWLKEHFIVVHQTGAAFAKENEGFFKSSVVDEDYHPFAFIHKEMPAVLQAADVVISRAGANSLWECAVCAKPMLLLPLSGSGTRGDQVDNANYFASQGAAISLVGEDVNFARLQAELTALLSQEKRAELSASCKKICGSAIPAKDIANILLAPYEEKNA